MLPFKRLTVAEVILTEREFEVFELFGEGKTPVEIGEVLCVSPKTISTHRCNIIRKMKFKSTYDLMYHAIRCKFYNEKT